jgi:hypothetical protein
MRIEHVYICASEHDLGYTRCCVASIRQWYPDIPISLLKDETGGPYDTSELEQAWDVGLFESQQPLPGRGWAKLEPLFLPGRQRCLLLDSDIVFLGRVIDRLEAIEADFVVESVGSRPGRLARDYFDPEGLRQVDPKFAFPGHTFNVGQLVVTSGILTRSDFEPFVRFGAIPQKARNDVFGNHETQGVLNYALLRKAQRGEVTLHREPFMLCGGEQLPRRGQAAIHQRELTAESPYPYVMHWAGPKRKLFWVMPNRRLLRHFEARYYSRIPGGRRKRLWRSVRLPWRILTRGEPVGVPWNWPRPSAPRERAPSKIDHVYINACFHDLRYTQCCVASIRRWYPHVPITLLKDETDGPYSTRELEHAWNVGVFDGEGPLPGSSWATLEPLFLAGRRRCLILDSDVVFLGRVLEPLEAINADFVVESFGGRPPDWFEGGYFDLDALKQLDPEFAFPGYTFNPGQLVATTGILKRSDFEPFVRFGPVPQNVHKHVFASVNQGVINYVLMKKAQQGELTLERAPFMEWGFTKRPRRGPQAIRVRALTENSPYPYLMHWSTKKPKLFRLTTNGYLLRHFEAIYYSRMPSGRRKRLWRSTTLTWRIITGHESHRIPPLGEHSRIRPRLNR